MLLRCAGGLQKLEQARKKDLPALWRQHSVDWKQLASCFVVGIKNSEADENRGKNKNRAAFLAAR